MRPKQTEKLRARTAQEWVEVIEAVESRGMQARLASIVWWDFFTDREGYGDELERFMEHAYEPEAIELLDAVVAEYLKVVCGYSQAMVDKKFKKNSQAMDQGMTPKHGALRRRDSVQKRARHWTAKERREQVFA